MTAIIEWVLELAVQDGQSDAVLPLIKEMAEATKADEPGAIHYEYFMNEERTTCTVLERYADNDAVMAHMANFGAKFAERFLTCFTPVRFTVYGPANDTVRKTLAGFGAVHLERVAGFHR